MSKKQFSIRVEEKIYKQLNDYRWAQRKTLNSVIEEAIALYLKHITIKESEAAHK